MQILLKYLPIPVIVLLVLALVLVFVYKYLITGNPAIKRKSNVLILFLFSLALGAIGLLAFVFFDSNISMYYLGSQVWCLLLGLLFWRIMKRRFSPYFTKTGATEWVFMFIPVTFGLTFFAFLFNAFSNAPVTFWFATCYLPFFIPYLADIAFRKYAAIPPEIYKVWYHPVDYEEPDFDRMDLSRIYLLDLEFSKTPSDTTITNFKAKAPLQMNFNDWFISFINNYNMKFEDSPIQYTNASGEPHGWIFYTKGNFFTGKKFIDPDVSVEGNKLKEGMVVVAKRVEVS